MSEVERQPFDAFEVQLVAEITEPDGSSFCETVDTVEQFEWAQHQPVLFMFTVYGHRTFPDVLPEDTTGYGATAIADFNVATGYSFVEQHQAAVDLATALAAGRVEVFDESILPEADPFEA